MITLQSISLSYSDGRQALCDISLTLQTGVKTALLGANGAGKSTLLNVIAGLQSPDGGTISGLKGKIGFLFQNSDDQLFMPTVWEDIRFGLMQTGLNASQADIRAASLLKRFDMFRLKDVPCRKLSGGEKKRVALAGVLATDPDILLLDEPTGQLDPRSRRKLIEFLNTLSQTGVIATHDLNLAQKTCQQAVVLDQGKVVAKGSIDDIINNDDLLWRYGLK